MLQISARADRDLHCNIFLKDGNFEYKVEHAWAQWPAEVKGSDVPGIACDEEDNLYVTTSHRDYPICIFAPDGKFLRTIGKGLFVRPHSVFVTSRKTLLCADSSAVLHAVRELDMDGNLVRNYGNPFHPSDSGYDVDAFFNAKIKGIIPPDTPYDNMTEFFLQMDTITHIAPPFNRPCHMIIAPNGEMFAADGYGNAAVHKFTPDGTLVKSWGGPGTETGKFRLVHWVWADKYNRIWVCDRENSRAYAYNTAGDIICVLQGGFRRLASCWSDDKNVYFGGLGGDLSIIDIDSLELVGQFGFPGTIILRCHGLCGDSHGNLYISSISGSRPTGNLFKFVRQ
ncbi:MAG: hypothetical protein LBR61_09240 [Synergistaceae bacterium]|jgi:sugar lactone lactonase YvrE|nr:hypothetical protein [Synergistaceae bacterium]